MCARLEGEAEKTTVAGFAGAERNIDCRRVGVAAEGPASQLTRVASSQLIPTHGVAASRRNYRRIAALPPFALRAVRLFPHPVTQSFPIFPPAPSADHPFAPRP